MFLLVSGDDGWGESSGGVFFSAELRFDGFFGVALKNLVDRPVYVSIKDDQAEIHFPTRRV